MLFWNFTLIFVLVILNGLFVAVEFAVVASRRARLELVANEDSRSAKIVKGWLENPNDRDRLIAAAQLGITVVSLALGAIGENTFEALLEPYFHDIVFPPFLQSISSVLAALPLVLSLIIVTSLHVVLGEQVPKVAALHAPEKMALVFAPTMQIFSMVFKWFVDILDWSTQQVLKIFGLQSGGEHSVLYSVDELKLMVTESEEGGLIETPEREMLHAIFDFGNTFVRQVMNPRTELLALEADTPLSESINAAIGSTFTKFPVYEGSLDKIIGFVHIRDLLRAHNNPDHQNCLARSLAREALFIPETLPLQNVLKEFRKRRQHIAIVLDEYGGTAGVVTLEDIMEEIVGEISDPFDPLHPEIQIQPDGLVNIDGLALIDEVNEKIGLNLFEPRYDTIAGYMLGKLERMPVVGDKVPVGDGRYLIVESMDDMRIEKLSLRSEVQETATNQKPEI
ncbi:MAG: HlyC/CorC family transporter [Anaerolineae bacterium]|nr:HlyC/CorC family transporter [Anaerolineae bacterium]